jgi:fructuronate reductase
MRFIARRAEAGEMIVDPLQERLSALGAAATGEAKTDVAAFLALDTVFPAALSENPTFVAALETAYANLS